MPSPATTDPERGMFVVARTELAEGVVLLSLGAADGGLLPAWEPGAHIDLVLTPDTTRQYSLCGDPRDADRWTIAVLHDPAGRGGSAYVHRELVRGARVRCRGPRNNFELVAADHYTFIAGGIGITPLLPMIGRAESAGASWRLVYGGRRRSSMAFVDELSRHGDRVLVVPEDERGIPDVDGVIAAAPAGAQVYCCGPEGLIGAVERSCSERAVSLHVERFAARTPIAVPADAPPVTVECRRSGITVTVSAKTSILEAIQDAGAQLYGSCFSGTCGTCEAGVIEGELLHLDSLLTDDERNAGDVMFPCVSRATSPRLVLDV